MMPILNIDQFRALVALPFNTSRGGNIFYEYGDAAVADELVELNLAVGDYSQHSHDHKAYRRSKRGDLLVAELLAHANLMGELQ